MTTKKPTRNDPCPCGSGKKYKQCCLQADDIRSAHRARANDEIAGVMRAAIEHQEAGRLVEADAACKQILQLAPDHPDALHLQAMIAYQVGMHDVASVLLQHVVEIAPNYADAHHNLGVVLMAQGHAADAASSYRTAIALQPKHASAHFNLGNALKDQGKLAEAITCYQQAIVLTPDRAPLYNNLADAFQSAGRLNDAIVHYRKALAIDPTLAEVHYNLGDALREEQKLDAAAASYRQAIQVRPNYAQAYNNLANVLERQGDLDQAVDVFRQAIAIKPDFVEAYDNLGIALQKQDKLDEAIARYRQAILISPSFAKAHNSLGEALYAQGHLHDAIASCRHAIALDPDFADACNSLCNMLREIGQLDEAVAFGQRALLLQPNDAQICTNLGNSLQAQGRLDEAIACYRQALSRNPDSAVAYSNLLYTMQFVDAISAADAFVEHQRYADYFEAPLKAHWLPHANSRDPARRLRIGYVSADFFNHAVAFFIEPILATHDKSLVEVFCYYNHTRHDEHTQRIKGFADHWLPCAHMSDEQLAERIRADGIDILVDLSGHTGSNRLPVFARKPAPVQATWIGYVGSTGLTAMDYRLTNAEVDPPGLTERYHSETLIRIPDTGIAYRPEPGCPAVNTLPALNSDTFTFASLNNLIKINASVIKVWRRILDALPHARLMLGNATDSGTRERVLTQFTQADIAAERLILLPRMSFNDYLALHHRIDVALDPFPYNGGTTTMHALWMGVPVITLAGEHMVSRCAVPLLSRVGLNDFITHSEDDYLQRAIACAQDLPALDRIRQSIRTRMDDSSQEAGTVTRHIEAAYRSMWQTWCVQQGG
ncbi:MAG: tetratricopeptide repeat protein [Thiobacillus sp.]|nr:tetratricopeptide repeat protein [Thiobacillus sp.]